jgi:enamine deaminase RidA (YjgF/YER057c/UK114 family)
MISDAARHSGPSSADLCGVAPSVSAISTEKDVEAMSITRIDPGARMSEAVIHGQTIYLAGQIGAPGADIVTQTKAVLVEIDELLERCGSDKHHILMATIWLADIADFEGMNSVWDGWVSETSPPARATGESRLATPDYRVEIIIVAARA